jgi:hypothetical protein
MVSGDDDKGHGVLLTGFIFFDFLALMAALASRKYETRISLPSLIFTQCPSAPRGASVKPAPLHSRGQVLGSHFSTLAVAVLPALQLATAITAWKGLLAEKKQEFGLGWQSSSGGQHSYRPDTLQKQAPDYGEE